MNQLVRFGVAIEPELLRRFDRVAKARGAVNRSEALRDLMRERLIDEEWRSDAETVGVVTLVYDHGVRELQQRLTDLQHQLAGQVISTLHVHIDARHCLEVILVRGQGHALGRFADRLVALKGVVYGKLLPATLGRGLWEHSQHGDQRSPTPRAERGRPRHRHTHHRAPH